MQSHDEQTFDEFMQQAQIVQGQLAQAQNALSDAEVTGTAGAGLVSMTLTAAGEMRWIRIDPRAVELDDVSNLERLIMAAYHDATSGIRELTYNMMAPLQDLITRADSSSDD